MTDSIGNIESAVAERTARGIDAGVSDVKVAEMLRNLADQYDAPSVTDVDAVIVRTADVEVSCDVHSAAWTRTWKTGGEMELVVDPVGMPDWLDELTE